MPSVQTPWGRRGVRLGLFTIGTADTSPFAAADVCECLGLINPNHAIRRLEPDDSALVSIEGVRIFGTPDAPLFCAADVCKCLGIGNASRALMRLDPEEKGITSSNTLRGMQELAAPTLSLPG